MKDVKGGWSESQIYGVQLTWMVWYGGREGMCGEYEGYKSGVTAHGRNSKWNHILGELLKRETKNNVI